MTPTEPGTPKAPVFLPSPSPRGLLGAHQVILLPHGAIDGALPVRVEPLCCVPVTCLHTHRIVTSFIAGNVHTVSGQWKDCVGAIARRLFQWIVNPDQPVVLSSVQKRQSSFISNYLLHLVEQFEESGLPTSFSHPEMMLLAYIYINRLAWQGEVVVTKENVRQLLAVSLRLSMKWMEDNRPKQTTYAKMAGFDIMEFNAIERSFSRLLDYRLVTDPEEYKTALRELGISGPEIQMLTDRFNFYGAATGASK